MINSFNKQAALIVQIPPVVALQDTARNKEI